MIAHKRRFRPSVLAIKAATNAGDISDLIHLRIDAISNKWNQFQRAPWYAHSESGRSALNGTGTHGIDLTRHIVGKNIRSVAGFSNRLGELDFPKDKTTSAQFLFDGDIVGQVIVTYEGRWPARKFIDDHLRILGTKGSVFGNRIYTEGQEDWKEIPVGKNEIVTGIKGCVDAFVDSVTSNAPIAVTGEDAFTTLAVADKSAVVVCVSSSRVTVIASPTSVDPRNSNALLKDRVVLRTGRSKQPQR
jgi:predicted dehydrogenase